MSRADPIEHQERVRRLAAVLGRSGLSPGPPQACSYLQGRLARYLAFAAPVSPPGLYHALMDLNFRRSGLAFYRPACDGCSECRAIRVPIASFRPSRAQRRCWGRNQDLAVTVAPPTPSEEKHALYRRYLAVRHDGQMDGSPEEFERFLYSTTVQTLELEYRLEGGLLAVALADLEPAALSAVYCYFEPTASPRSLGVFNVLSLIEECRRRELPHLYLGYYVRSCRKMDYKVAYRPNEILDVQGRWIPRER
jgi:arginine-tRNA-protein transferase